MSDRAPRAVSVPHPLRRMGRSRRAKAWSCDAKDGAPSNLRASSRITVDLALNAPQRIDQSVNLRLRALLRDGYEKAIFVALVEPAKRYARSDATITA